MINVGPNSVCCLQACDARCDKGLLQINNMI